MAINLNQVTLKKRAANNINKRHEMGNKYLILSLCTIAVSLPRLALADEKMTLDHIGADLTAAGYASTVQTAQQATGIQLGTIITNLNGPKALINVMRCPNDPSGTVCDLQFNVIFPDNKNSINDTVLAKLNSALFYAKATKILKSDGSSLLRISYSYYFHGLNSTKPIVEFLEMFRVDVNKAIPSLTAG